jgi:hypothetical protein
VWEGSSISVTPQDFTNIWYARQFFEAESDRRRRELKGDSNSDSDSELSMLAGSLFNGMEGIETSGGDGQDG